MKVEETIQQATETVRKYLPAETQVVLFGSWAKENAIPTSDIDIGLLGNAPIPFTIMVKIKQAIEDLPTLRKIDVVDLNAVDDHFKKHALKHAKPL